MFLYIVLTSHFFRSLTSVPDETEFRKKGSRSVSSSTSVEGRSAAAVMKTTKTTCLIETKHATSQYLISIKTRPSIIDLNPSHITFPLPSLVSLHFTHSRYPSLQLSSSIGTNILCIAWSAFYGLLSLRYGAWRFCFLVIISYVEASIIDEYYSSTCIPSICFSLSLLMRM